MKRPELTQLARSAAACLAIALCFGGPLAGCKKGDGLSSEQRQQGDRLAEIGKKTDGDWNKLTDSDREFLLSMGHGSEQTAKWLLLGAAHKIGNAGGGQQAPASGGGAPAGTAGPPGGGRIGPPGGFPTGPPGSIAGGGKR